MNTVWVLIALVNNGHFTSYVVPTLVFSSRERCQAAIQAFEADTQNQRGIASMRCVRIEK